MDYHSRATSRGTRRGIRGYWAAYHRAKAKFETCPMANICWSEFKRFGWATQPKRRLLVDCCSSCAEGEGWVKAKHRDPPHRRQNYYEMIRFRKAKMLREAKKKTSDLKMADDKQLENLEKETSHWMDDNISIRTEMGYNRTTISNTQKYAGVEPLKKGETRDYDALEANFFRSTWKGSWVFKDILLNLRVTLLVMGMDPDLANIDASPNLKGR